MKVPNFSCRWLVFISSPNSLSSSWSRPKTAWPVGSISLTFWSRKAVHWLDTTCWPRSLCCTWDRCNGVSSELCWLVKACLCREKSKNPKTASMIRGVNVQWWPRTHLSFLGQLRKLNQSYFLIFRVRCLKFRWRLILSKTFPDMSQDSKASMKPHLILLPLGVSNAMCIVDRQCIFDLLGCWHRGGFDSHFPQPSV